MRYTMRSPIMIPAANDNIFLTIPVFLISKKASLLPKSTNVVTNILIGPS